MHAPWPRECRDQVLEVQLGRSAAQPRAMSYLINFDELALISFESAEEQAKSEAAFWNSDSVESNRSDSSDCDE